MRIPRRESSHSPDEAESYRGDYAPSAVESWRLHILEEAGYPFALAQRLAMSAAVDLHVACEIVAGGCSPEVAADILL